MGSYLISRVIPRGGVDIWGAILDPFYVGFSRFFKACGQIVGCFFIFSRKINKNVGFGAKNGEMWGVVSQISRGMWPPTCPRPHVGLLCFPVFDFT